MSHTSRRPLDAGQVERHPSSYVDPSGYVFRHEGRIYRAIRHGHEDFYRALLTDGRAQRLTSEHGLVATRFADIELDDPDVAFVLGHEEIAPQTYCVEWCPAMLLAAARRTVELLAQVTEFDATLQDAYPWNIVFDGPRPVMVDFTSITPVRSPLPWPALEQFQAFFQRPLDMAARGRGRLSRALLQDNINGVTLGQFVQVMPVRYRLTHPGASLSRLVDGFVQRRPELKKRLRGMTLGGEPAQRAVRQRFVAGLGRRLEGYRFDQSADLWSAYYEDIEPEVDKERKLHLVGELLERIAPPSVLDAGCNVGVFSMLAARQGAQVIALDSSEACVNRLFAEARREGLAIVPLVADLVCPTPAFGFMGEQYPALPGRVRSHTVLCLALMHHLHIAGRQSFDRIARLLDALAARQLIFEFVAMDDANNDLIGAGRDIGYDLAGVTAALGRYFPTIEVMESDRPTRRLLVCEKPR